MLPDNHTNFLYLADTLPKKYPAFYERFVKILEECKIDFALLPRTRDVWAVDYMPIQVSNDCFIQFEYKPDYLIKYKKWQKTISDVDSICKAIHLCPEKSEILLDGGNVMKTERKVIMTDKVFSENPGVPEKQLIHTLQNLFEVDKLIFVPKDPHDIAGHADGMVRFVDVNTVLINDYSGESPAFQTAFRMSLHNAGLEYIEIPYCPDLSTEDSAKGLYINYLQMKDTLIIPVFDIAEDEQAVRQLEQIFPGYSIKTIESSELAVHGGVLNCISWNIMK